MELQFHKTEYPYLRTVLLQPQTQEQTLDIKLSEGMPDIGRVLFSWGQPVLRSMEWRSDGAQVTGGVMVWVLYQPEDGSSTRVVEGWLPFQMHWDFPGSQRDGLLLVQPWLRNVEARCVSSRKLMIRGDIAVQLQALQPDTLELFVPGDVPEYVELLRNTYPVQMLSEAGEKAFLIDEDLQSPEDLEQVLYYTLHPMIHDHKVVADKVVFRGTAQMHLLYLSNDGKINTWDHEMPFSQFAELDREYTQASVHVVPAVTSMELEKGDLSALRLKAGLTGQYTVSRYDEVEVVEDAYRPGVDISLQSQMISLPISCEITSQSVTAQLPVDGNILDVGFLQGLPSVKHGDTAQVELCGHFQVLYADEEGALQGCVLRWEGEHTPQLKSGAHWMLQMPMLPKISANGVRVDLVLEGQSDHQEGKYLVSGLTIPEDAVAKPHRPSLILRRAGENSLWQIARECGSTVDRICQINHLQEQPERDRMLLIPVI